MCRYVEWGPNTLRGGLGFAFHPGHWGRGYATEVVRALLTFGHTALRLDRIEATCRPDNLGSAKALLKAGLQQEALLRSHIIIRGERRDSLLLASVRGRP